MDDETEQRIKELHSFKEFSFGLTEFVNTLEIPEERKTATEELSRVCLAGLDMLDHAEKLVTNAASLEAIARMRKVYTALYKLWI